MIDDIIRLPEGYELEKVSDGEYRLVRSILEKGKVFFAKSLVKEQFDYIFISDGNGSTIISCTPDGGEVFKSKFNFPCSKYSIRRADEKEEAIMNSVINKYNLIFCDNSGNIDIIPKKINFTATRYAAIDGKVYPVDFLFYTINGARFHNLYGEKEGEKK